MKKTGLVAVHNDNYGSLLQTYAFQQYINEIGVNNEIILYKKKTDFRQLLRIFNFQLLKMKGNVVYRDVYSYIFNSDLKKYLNNRKEKFKEFKKRHLRFSNIIIGRKELLISTSNYSYFILGSDQVWNPINIGTDYYTLNFVPSNVPKIVYSPSFGVSKIPHIQKKKTRKYLNRIDHLSIREESGQQIIRELIGKDVPVVCDPTILIDKSYWDKLKGDEPIIKGKYIFCYFLGNRPLIREFAKKLKTTTGLQIVSLLHLDEYIKTDCYFPDIKPYNIGPSEFVNLISNATIILTDSFHGTIFSILYKKIFFSFSRHEEKSISSTNNRIDSLLARLQIPERKLSGIERINDCLKLKLEYKKVFIQLYEFRNASRKYLHNAIKSVNNDRNN